MNFLLKIKILFIFYFFILDAYSHSGVGSADVRDKNGTPCFSIAAKEEADMGGNLAFGRVYVYEKNHKSKEIWHIWRINDDPLIPFSSAICLRYGEKIPGTTGIDPLPLDVGKIYGVGLILYPQKNLRPHKVGNIGDFCLIPLNGGGIKVHQILWDESAQRWRTEVCDSVAPSK
jgi:hypothetical protein